MFKIGDRDAGTAAYTLRNEQKGMPPNWAIYIAVENADVSAKRASELGGKICVAPFDVFDVGRMAVVQDPTGGTFCLWQARQKPNAVSGVEGTLCWADLSTPDPEVAGNSTPASLDGSWRNRSTILQATCTSRMASSSSEAFLQPNIVRQARRTGFRTLRWQTATPQPPRRNKAAPLFTSTQ